MFPPYEQIMRRPVSAVMAQELASVQPRMRLTRLLERIRRLRAAVARRAW